MPAPSRRHFLQCSAAVATSAFAAGNLSAAQETPAKAAPSERVRVGCVGVGGRAAALVHGFASLKEVEVVGLCDIDPRRLAGAAEALEKRTGKKPAVDTDFRKIVDDPSIDVLTVGTGSLINPAVPEPAAVAPLAFAAALLGRRRRAGTRA